MNSGSMKGVGGRKRSVLELGDPWDRLVVSVGALHPRAAECESPLGESSQPSAAISHGLETCGGALQDRLAGCGGVEAVRRYRWAGVGVENRECRFRWPRASRRALSRGLTVRDRGACDTGPATDSADLLGGATRRGEGGTRVRARVTPRKTSSQRPTAIRARTRVGSGVAVGRGVRVRAPAKRA